jgi:hypothetical protein
MDKAKQKRLALNIALLLGCTAVLFKAYLPVADEIQALNQEMRTYESQQKTLKMRYGGKTPDKIENHKAYAVPEAEVEHMGPQLETLAGKHRMKLIHLEPDNEKAESIAKLKIRLVPYTLAFSGKDMTDFARLLSEIESGFPEVVVRSLRYEKEVGTLDVLVLTSTQNVRLFAP